MICPPLNHLNTLIPVLITSVGPLHVVVLDLVRLMLDGIRIPFSAFVEECRRCRTKAVRDRLALLIRKAMKGGSYSFNIQKAVSMGAYLGALEKPK